jgi:hypothetical protein
VKKMAQLKKTQAVLGCPKLDFLQIKKYPM